MPNSTADFLTDVAAGILAVLVVATIAGRLLKTAVAPSEPHAVIDNINARIVGWWIIVALLFVAASLGPIGLALLFATASLQTVDEFMPPDRPRATVPWTALVVLLIVHYLLGAMGLHTAFMLLAPTFALLSLAASTRPTKTAGSWSSAAAAAMLCIYGISHVPALATLDVAVPAITPLGPALFLVVVVQASDVMQYIAGKTAGRHALAPRLSPGKTIEGAIGGIVGAGALGTLLSPLTPYSAAAAAGIASMLAGLGVASGLMFSTLKRRRGLKDWGTLIPGHGGVLDRIDSLCLPAPVFYHLLRTQAGT